MASWIQNSDWRPTSDEDGLSSHNSPLWDATANPGQQYGLAAALAYHGCTLIGPWLRHGLMGGRDLSHGSVGYRTRNSTHLHERTALNCEII